MRERRAGTGNIKSISLTVACIQGSDAGQKCFQILRIFNFGVQLWLTRIRSDLVTAQLDLPIKLESIQNDSDLYLYAVWRFGRLINPLQNRTFWPVNYQNSSKLSPNLTDYCGSAVHAHAFIYIGWIGDGREGTHRKYKVHILYCCLPTVLRCRSKMFSNFKNIQFWRPAVTDPHKVRPCNCTGRSPNHIGIDPEWFSPLYISRVGIWPFDGPLQNRTFWPVNYQISTKLSPSLTDYCGSAVHRHAFIFTGWIGDGT